MIITIDGPAGTGKSTVAKRIAQRLGFFHFDTGAMYRALAYGIIQYNVEYTNSQALTDFLNLHPLTVKIIDKHQHVFLNGHDVTNHIRTREVAIMASKTSAIPAIRDSLVSVQRELGKGHNAVFEGRDLGTVVFPKAELKIYLTATPEVRAERRYRELLVKNPKETFTKEEILHDIIERDNRDSNRAISPLKPAPKAYIIDTSNLSIDDVVEQIITFVPR